MPQAHGGPTQLVTRTEMEVSRGEKALRTDTAPISPPDETTVAGKGPVKHRNKQSLDYVLRSGLAGGLAACTVSRTVQRLQLEGQADLRFAGQNRSWTP